jgi:hypothetical protein
MSRAILTDHVTAATDVSVIDAAMAAIALDVTSQLLIPCHGALPVSSATPTSATPALIDPRSPRFGAAITAVVLVIVLVTSSGWLLAAQAVVFAIGAIAGIRYAPYGYIYRSLIRPRLGNPTELEDPAPPRFAQGVALVFVGIGAVGYLAGVTPLGIIMTAAALAAAFLNAAFDYCLGCEMYLRLRRLAPHRG